MHALHKFMLVHVLTCFGHSALGSEIINGEIAPANDLLYMASVQNKDGHLCGGFLISEDFVVTAAHCDKSPTKVVLGAHNLQSADKIVRGIVKKCKNPDYVNIAKGHDIMLLKLSSKVQTSKRTEFIQLPPREIILMESEKCRVAGWGFTYSNGRSVDSLRVVDVSVIGPQVCREQWPRLPDNVICAGGYNTTKGFCQGDSGGPLVCRGMAVGVVSFNHRGICKYPNKPNIYADITKDLNWIQKILKESDC